MFNAIFGSIFSQQKVDTVDEASQQQHDPMQQRASLSDNMTSAEASTQTAGSTTTRLSYSAVVSGSSLSRNNSSNNTKPDQDWVIVDPSEEADKLNKYTTTHEDEEVTETVANKVEPQELARPTASVVRSIKDETEDIMLRSFFDRAEQDGVKDDEARKQGAFIRSVYKTETPMEKQPVDQWLITPLPCLTSAASTQVENGPLENLFIEQPCVFMNTTPAVVATPVENVVPAKQMPVTTPSNDVVMASPTPTPTVMPVTPSAATAVRRMHLSYSSIVKSSAEKRKESEPVIYYEEPKVIEAAPMPQSLTVVEVQVQQPTSVVSSRAASPPDSPKQTRTERKASKKAKKNPNSPPLSRHNKENLAVKILLMSDFHKMTSVPRLDDLMANGKQMKRNNRSTVLTSSSSLKQRKYHNLQQPVSFNSINNQF